MRPPAYLERHIGDHERRMGRRPHVVERLGAEDVFDPVDVVYPVGRAAYAHVYHDGTGLRYVVVEPVLEAGAQAILPELRTQVFRKAMYRPPPEDRDQLEADLLRLLHGALRGRRGIPAHTRDALEYHLIRNVSRMGLLEPFLNDENLEDIQAVGTNPIHVIHRYYGMLPTDVRFSDEFEVHKYIRTLSEQLGRPVSDARPIVDATLGDGSRINIVFSEDVSRKGPSFSIRRVHEHPISITQLIAWRTMTAQTAAYLWLALENGMSLFVCGEAACGKSATLNALLSFVDPRAKIYTAEDTPEVRPPHQVWQRLLTRETGPAASRVSMFDLLKAALRSRPNYIVVGEIRGAEGAVAFQAMQTGHPTVATFHATDKVKMIQRLSAPPISVPLTFIDNLNIAVFQQAMRKDGRLVRRVTAVDEIQGYSEIDGGVVTLPVFSFDGRTDTTAFQGRNNSFILERKIAEQRGYEDPKEIYHDLDRRTRVLQAMADNGILHHTDVNRMLVDFAERQEEALPFEVPA